jgi:hypothetical protein
MFDVVRILPNNFGSLTQRHRNIVTVLVDPSIAEPSISAQYDVTAAPQIQIAIQGPDNATVAKYVSDNRETLLYVLEKAERDRKINYVSRYYSEPIHDLLKERFSEGMIVEVEVDRELYDRYVVPCSVQLLVENATKHNIVSADQPLTIKIANEGDILVVRNRLQPRTHGQPSTRLGLENIRRQYQDITHMDISVEKTDNEFIVKLPIV